ncbi:MAG: NADH:flavin oxidoreductase [Anaerolineae bacterium]|nr:NADH:flavin oxidoreductase [Anaerolineae bacterium]
MVSDIFQAYHLAGVKLKNRILRSATHEGLGDEKGFPLPQLAKKYVSLAKGGVGAIITGEMIVQGNGGSSYYGDLKIDRDESIESYRKLVDAVHAYQTPIFAQLTHCGRQTRSKVTGQKPVAPSAIRDKHYNEEIPKELSEAEIEEIIGNFVAAIIRARAAGFDGVQLHAAHGYLLSQFLSPYMNRRVDKWGGSLENRFRIIQEIFGRATAMVGDYPIIIKINAYDGRKNGMRLEEAVKIARMLQNCGCAAIEISCGIREDNFLTMKNASNPVEAVFHYSFKCQNIPIFLKPILKRSLQKRFAPTPPVRLYNVSAAQTIKAAVSVPVIVVGGIRALGEIEDIITNHKADLVSLSRPFILEPTLVKKFKNGTQTEAKCISCCHCALGIEEGPLRCYFGRLSSDQQAVRSQTTQRPLTTTH